MAMGIKETYSLILYHAFANTRRVKFSWLLLFGFLSFFRALLLFCGAF